MDIRVLGQRGQSVLEQNLPVVLSDIAGSVVVMQQPSRDDIISSVDD